MFTVATVPLAMPTREMRDWIARSIPVSDAIPHLDRSWPGSRMSNRSVSFPSRTRAPRYVRVNSLEWPLGAARYTLGFLYATGYELTPIRNVTGDLNGESSNPVQVAFGGDTQISGNIVTLTLTLLKITPLNQFTASDRPDFLNGYILTFVDQRYFWQFTPCPPWSTPIPRYGTAQPPSGSRVPTWLSLFNDVATALDITLTVDTIPTAYLSPDPSLNLAGAPIGPVLDALAANVGHRIVANYDGTFNSQNAGNASSARTNDVANNPLRTVVAGGDLFQDDL